MNEKLVADRRVCMERFSYTRMQRLRIWWNGVRNAITETPPATDYREVVIGPNDPRWDDPFTYDLVEISSDLGFKVGIMDDKPDA